MSQDDVKNFNVELFGNDITDPEWVQHQLSGSYYSGLEQNATEKLGKMYKFSDYLVDPNKYRFRKVFRIVALVMKFIKLVQQKIALRKNVTTTPQKCDHNLPAILKLCDDE